VVKICLALNTVLEEQPSKESDPVRGLAFPDKGVDVAAVSRHDGGLVDTRSVEHTCCRLEF
jgi:hypothetical protein